MVVIFAYNMTSVSGVKNVINACQECKVKRLIYNSSGDVVFDGSHDICNGDESLPCPWKVCAFLEFSFWFLSSLQASIT